MDHTSSRSQLPSGHWQLDGTEESRALLQERLTLLAKLLFAVLFLAFASATAAILTTPAMQHLDMYIAHGVASTGPTVLALVWWRLRRGDSLSLARLHAIDTMLCTLGGLGFSVGSYLSGERPEMVLAELLIIIFLVFGRALVLPSSARRTLVLSALMTLPLCLAIAVRMAVYPDHNDIAPAVLLSMLIGAAVGAAAIASLGSSIIYGLRERAHEAERMGQYRLISKLGEGGMGTVYRAEHAMLRRPTAIKLLRADRVTDAALERFEREVQLTSELTHPNTIAIYDFGRSLAGVFYYAMEYLDGIDLEQLVRRHGPQPQARVVHILVQACGALEEAHRRELVHRDIKPANIFLCQRGLVPDVVKVLDFGLALALAEERSEAEKQQLAGTPAYLAPEAITDPERVGPASDLYGLGAVGYFLLTGTTVFSGETLQALCTQHIEATPEAPSKRLGAPVSSQLEAVLLACLAKRPEDRPGSAAALAEKLRALADIDPWQESDARAFWSQLGDGMGADERQEMAVAETLAVSRTITLLGPTVPGTIVKPG